MIILHGIIWELTGGTKKDSCSRGKRNCGQDVREKNLFQIKIIKIEINLKPETLKCLQEN